MDLTKISKKNLTTFDLCIELKVIGTVLFFGSFYLIKCKYFIWKPENVHVILLTFLTKSSKQITKMFPQNFSSYVFKVNSNILTKIINYT